MVNRILVHLAVDIISIRMKFGPPIIHFRAWDIDDLDQEKAGLT